MIQQVMDEIGIPGHYVSADAVSAASSVWLQQQWETARIKHKSGPHKKGFILYCRPVLEGQKHGGGFCP